MGEKKKFCKKQIKLLKVLRVFGIPIGVMMYYFSSRAWGAGMGLTTGAIFGIAYYCIISGAIVDIIGGELKNGVEDLIKKVTASPVHIECSKIWGRMSFLIFLQEDNETVTKFVYKKVIDRLKTSEYFSAIEILSMANVPDLKKETIAKFKMVMLENAIEMSKRDRKENER